MVHELTELVGEPQNLVSYHLGKLRDGRLVSARRSSADRRDTYYGLDLARIGDLLSATGGALHPGLRLDPPARDDALIGPVRVLFLCTGNSARSQMAEALVAGSVGRRHRGGAAPAAIPGPLHPNAVRVMRDEYGLDLAGHASKHLEVFAGQRFDWVISLCDRVREVCPEFPGHPADHPLEHRQPRDRRARRRHLPAVPADRRRAGDPHRVPARRARRSNTRAREPRRKPMTDLNEMVSVRYMVDDVAEAVDFYTKFLGFEVLNNFPAVRGRRPRQAAAAAQRTGQFRGTADGRRRQARPWRLEPHPPHRRRHRRRGRPPARRRRAVSQRRSSRDRAASRSCCRTPPATSSSSFSQPQSRRDNGASPDQVGKDQNNAGLGDGPEHRPHARRRVGVRRNVGDAGKHERPRADR